MKKISKLIYTAFIVMIGFSSGAQQLAFPGAEGYGRFASGGRGNGTTGRVVEVTNLEDDLTNPPVGSFRWAFTQATEQVVDPILGTYTVKRPITIVFKVGGVINLKGELRISRNNVAIAGQTAPGDGICFRGATLNFSASNNVIVRYLRSRPGDELGLETSAFRIENGSNFIIDHCSFSWAIEETTHFSSNSNSTVQWSIISESLYNSVHKKGARGYGTQWGGQYASYHHNLLADHNSRMPRINGSNVNDKEALVDYRNNVNFNWGSAGAFYGGEWEGTGGNGFCHTNVVNNYFIPGPATTGTTYFARPSLNRSGVTLDGYGKWFFNGNVMVGSDDKTNDNWLGVDASGVGGAANIRSDNEFVKTDGVLEAYGNYTQTAAEAFASVMENVGAILPKRDLIDARVIAEAKGERAIVRYAFTTIDGQVTPMKGVNSGLIDTQRNLVPDGSPEGYTPWDIYKTSTEAPLDTDHDGIPDIWEMAHGLNIENVNDGRLIASNGYSNLENYLNSLDVSTSVGEIINPDYFDIYPNPVQDLMRINCSEHITKLELFDIFGKKLQSVEQLSGIASIPSGNLKKGIYLIKATSETNRTYFQKIIKQ
jgi:pectate lyase